jgi:asparagine synthetase B (glutamine-hydrolysing)
MILFSKRGARPVLTDTMLHGLGYALMLEPSTNIRASDILTAYRNFGEACARHLCGDFAFVLWDACTQRLIVSRSVTGRCPLYITRLPHGICWSSDPLTFLNHISGEANLSWIVGWLLRSEDSWDASPWQDVDPVLPGHTLIYDVLSGHRQTQASWVPPVRLNVNDLSFAEAAEHFRSLFLQTIVTRMQDHEQVSFDCSGGLASSSLVASVAYLQEQGRFRQAVLPILHGYSERFAEEDGRPYLMALTKRYPAIEPHLLNYDTVCLRPLVIQEQQYPTTHAVVLPALFQERLQQITTIGSTLHLSGEYGDHLFAPTIRWLWHQWPWQVARELMEWQSLCAPHRLL